MEQIAPTDSRESSESWKANEFSAFIERGGCIKLEEIDDAMIDSYVVKE